MAKRFAISVPKKTGFEIFRSPFWDSKVLLQFTYAGLCVLYLVDDGLEGCGVVEGEVGEDFAVDFDACFVDETHQFGV